MVFKEFVAGAVRHTADIIKYEDIADHVQSANGEAMFMSVYDFHEDYAKYAKEHKSVAGFDGPVSISKLFFDIDLGKGKTAITDEMCLKKARNLVDELINKWDLEPHFIQPWFSGRGYHIVTPDFFGFGESNDVPTKVKATLTHYFKEIDPMVYDKVRLLRMGNSKHAGSGLYKIPLTLGELMRINPEGIKILAKEKRIENKFNHDWSNFQPIHEDKILDKIIHKETPHPLAYLEEDTEKYRNPSNYMSCCQKIYDQGPVKGNRHKTVLVLSSWLRRAGLSASISRKLMIDWLKNDIADPNNRMTSPEVNKIVNQVFDKPYFYWCDNPIMKTNCQSNCVYYERREDNYNFKSNEEVTEDFIDWYMGFNHDDSIDIGGFLP